MASIKRRSNWSLRRKDCTQDEESLTGASSSRNRSSKIPKDLFNSFLKEVKRYEFEDKYQQWSREEKEAASQAWAWPADDLSIQVIPHASRFAENPLPPSLRRAKTRGVKPYILQSVEYFTADQTRIRRAYADDIPVQDLKRQGGIVASLRTREMCPISGSTALGEEKNDEPPPSPSSHSPASLPVQVNEQLVKDCEHVATLSQSNQRVALFQTYAGAYQNLPKQPMDRLYPSEGESSGPAVEFIVEPAEISFELGAVEPFLGSLALYNFAKKKKISETYYFHCNERGVLNLVQDKDQLPEFMPAIFRLSHSSPDVFFILRVEKILQGDVETVAEPYLKYDTIRAKDKEKYVTAVTAAAGRYTMWQPFGWAVAPLLNEDNAIPDSITFKPIYRTREQDIQDVSLITSHSEGKGSSKKMKSIPGRCVVRIKQIPPSDVVPGRLSPSLVPLKPTADRGFREIQEFALSPALTPYTEYVNDMFLYLESANLSARTGSPSAKDIAVQVKLLDSDADIHAEGLPVMYAPGRNALVSSVTTPVTYHNKSPHFYSEIKVALPAVLHATHHLVFTFYQVNVQPTKSGKSGGVTVPVAYAFWQIYPNDRVVSKDTLPIYTEVSAGYLSEEAAGDLKPIDGGKPLLTVRNKLYSTIYTQDINMNNVLRRMKTITATTKMDAALKPLDLLMKVHAVRIVKYFPVLMNYIFKLLSASSAHTTQVFSVIPEILVSINEANPNHTFALLRGYSDNTFDLCEANEKGDYIHDILVREWLVYVRDSPLDCEVLLKHSSFLFKIIFKSMVLKIYDTGELNDATTRKTRFTTEFGDNLRSLVVVLAWEVYQRNKSALTLCKDLARNIAAFCNDLFAVADRAVVLEAIELFLYQLNSDSVMNDFKFEFLRVLLEYEHFLALSLPRSSVAGLPPMSETMAFFQERHYLAALIIRDLGQHLQQDNKSNRIKAMDVVRRAFTSYDYDEALQRAPEKHKQAITVFFPLLGLIVDHPLASDTNPVLEEQRDLMICFLYLLKHCDNGLLQQWFKRQAIGDIKRFFATVYSCIQSFQFMERWEWVERMTESSEIKSSSAMKESIESFYSAGGIPKRTTFRQQRAEAKAKEAEGSGEERAFKRTLNRKNTGSRDISQAADYRENLESNLSTEAMFVLTDAVKVYLDILTEEDCNSQLFEKVCTFITTMLMHKQSIDFLQSFFAFLRFFVEKFGLLLFQDSSFLGQICFHVMNYCNSSHAATRQQASALLFLLMQKHHRCFPAQFQRIAVHITVAVSRLVGRGLKGQTDSYLKSSLSAVLEYAAMDKDHGEALSESVKDLVERLFMVLQDNMKISEHSDDPDMMADLYCRLAHGYINAPSLRITWLESLGNFHSRRGRFAESAMCNLHIAAMIAEYLNVVRPQPGLPHGCSTFLPISPNVLEETAIRDTSVITEDNDESGVFTEDKLVDFLTHTVEELKAGDLFEMAADVYGALLPIHQKNLQFTLMQTAHSQLSQIYGDIVECMASQRRMLGSYYRVGFYGDAFEELNKMEFIYKEPKITKLVEIKDRLHKLYQAKLAGVEVKIIVHSNTVNTDELDATTAYIQITSVEPYFDPNELESRKTAFAQKVSLQRFIYVTPFTKQGKARTESVADQYIRKTILETERQFPYLRTRLPVIEKKLIELNPLEHTIAEVQKQTARILRESHAQNPSLKTLQPVLSGSVCLQVQAGPLEYSRVFFLERAEEWQKEQLEELRSALLKFLEACQVGIEQHAALCETENDSAFQANLEAGYADTEKKMKDHYNKFMLLSQSFTV